MAINCTWLQVYSALVYLMVYKIYKVCLALMYMQHKHMVYGKFHIHHYLVLDKNANDNSYSTPLRHEVFNVDHKMVILGIDLCYNTSSHLGVQYQHYYEHDNFCLSILFPWIIYYIFPDKTYHFCGSLLSDGVEIP